MKRPKRIKLAWVASLTAVAVVTAGWARSYWRVDVLSHIDTEGATRAIVSRAGGLHVVDARTNAALEGIDFGSYDLPEGARLPVLHNPGDVRWHRLGFALVRTQTPPPRIVVRPPAGVPQNLPPTVAARQPAPRAPIAGRMIGPTAPPIAHDVVPWLSGLPYFELVVPYWSLATLAMLYPLVRGAIALRRHRRRRRGLCGDCGYDLRATGDRCPECGASVPPQSQPARTVDAVVA